MNAAKNPAAAESFSEIALVRIELSDTDPLIWREVEVPTTCTLLVLNDIVQAVIGWCNEHLWEFTIARKRYGLPMKDDWGDRPLGDARKVRLRDVLGPGKTKIDYIYDFGDSWEHRLVVSRVRQGEAGTEYPRYLGGEQNGPPEDCGGIPGFYNSLDALADPKHPDHAHASEWFEEYDPEEIDTVVIGFALSRIAKRRNAAAKRLANTKAAPKGQN